MRNRSAKSLRAFLPWALGLVLAALSPFLLAGDPEPSALANQAKPSFEAYQNVYRKSVFLQNRRIATPRRVTPPRRVEPPRDPAADWVLCGVMTRDAQLVALLENASTGEATLLSVGQTIVGRQLTRVTLDFVAMKLSDGATRQYAVGDSLSGAAFDRTSPTSSFTTSQATTSPTTSAPKSEMTDESTKRILEQLRLKRQRELGGQ